MMDQPKYNKFWGGVEIPFKKSEEDAWKDIKSRIDAMPIEEKKVVRMWPAISAAAAIALLVGLLIFWPSNNEAVVVATIKGSSQLVELPDLSKVTLAPDAEITFSNDWSEERKLTLKGEAFFEVQKGSTFTVETALGNVQVLGTSFDVSDRNNELSVICETGRVKVTSGKQEVIITPGMMARASKGVLVAFKAYKKGNQWMDGKFVYENEPLVNVLDEIERQFNVEIQYNNLDSKVYVGEFNSKNLEEALIAVCAPFGLNYTIKDNMIVEIK